MRPMISNTPYYKLNIPEMSGGINLRDGISSINDNQLSEGKNVWFRDGLLRTRPAIRDMSAIAINEGVAVPSAHFVMSDVFNDGERVVAVRLHAQDFNTESPYFSMLRVGQGTVETIGPCYNIFSRSLFVTEKDGDVYAFVDGAGTDYWNLVEGCEYAIFKNGEEIGIRDVYIPTIATHCVTTGKVKITDAGLFDGYEYEGFSCINKEGYNLLTPYYKFVYTTVNKDTLTTDSNVSKKYPMSYKTPECPYKTNPNKCKDLHVTAKITDADGNSHYHGVQIGADGTGIETNNENCTDKLIMQVTPWSIDFMDKDTKQVKMLSGSDYVENNLEITFPSPIGFKDYEKVSKMTRTAWFGGEASGIAGGTRLFLCGSTREGDENLVIWSDLNNPLYFPEHNCARIGNPTTKTTAFGKLGDKLVIFKENEIFYTKYVESSSLTADALESQMIYDVTMATAYFPMVELNSVIGCDCPDTIQLCNNRLVWTTSAGNVYELVSDSQYNENNVYEISQMIEPMLSKETNLKMSSAADWDGKYLLAVGNKIYVMDYSSYGFSSIYSYSKKEDANKHIPWWFWDFDRGFGCDVVQHILSLNGKCVVLRLETIDESRMVCVASTLEPEKREDLVFSWDESDVESKDKLRLKISSSAQTKFFNFGAPTVKKNIPKIELSLGANGGEPVQVDIITDKGTEENELIIDDETSNNKLPNYFVNRLIRVGDKNAHRIGLKFKCDGAFSLESMSLQYKQLGGLK